MNIKKWVGSNKDKLKIRCYKLKKNGGRNMEGLIKRPNTILQSLGKSFKEIEDFKSGKKKLKTLEESQHMWNKWIEESENESE